MASNIIGERMKRLREEVFLTQSELATEVGLTRLSISNYELGKRTPDLATIEKLSAFFKCDTNFLIGKSDYKNNDTAVEFVSSVEHLNEALKKFDSTQIQNLLDSLEIYLGVSVHMSDSETAQGGIDLLSGFVRDLTAMMIGMQMLNSDNARQTMSRQEKSDTLVSLQFQKDQLKRKIDASLDEMLSKAQSLAGADIIDFHQTFINMSKHKENIEE